MDRHRTAVSGKIWIQVLAQRLLWLTPLTFLAVFFVYPLTTILSVSLAPEGLLDLSGFAAIATTPYYLNTLAFTAAQAALSTILVLGLAVPGAYVATRFVYPGRRLFGALAGLPFVLPTVVVAAAYLALVGPRGLLNLILMRVFDLGQPPIQIERTLTIILIAHIFYNYGVAYRMIAAFWVNRSERIEEAARALGITGWALWWRVRLPILRPVLLAAGALVFTYCFTSFGVIVILGGPRFATLEVEIYRQIANLFDLPTAAALSLVQIVFMLVTLLTYTRLERRAGIALQAGGMRAHPPKRLGDWALVALNQTLIAAFLLAPLAALVMRAFTTPDGKLTLANFAALGVNPRGSVLAVPPFEAFQNSLSIAVATTTLALILGFMAALALHARQRPPRWIEPLLMLPLASSAVVLGFGFNLALDEPPLNLRSAWILLPIAHTLIALPFVLRSLAPALNSLPPHLEEAAKSMGLGTWGIFRRVQLPLIRPALAVGTVYAFTISLGEFGATLFVARPNSPTLPIAIYRLLGQPGEVNYGRALALSVLLLLVCGIAFWLMEWWQTSD
jgi:thiamine transport system permease protein